MSEMTVKTNRIPRPIINGYELSDNEKKEFDFLEGEELDCASFVRYKGNVHYLGNFMRYSREHNGIVWHGAESDSYFSGTLIHLSDDGETAILGWYCS